VVVAEGAKPIGGRITVHSRPVGRSERLGGVGEKVADELHQLTGKETRLVVLGHLLRGGRQAPPIASLPYASEQPRCAPWRKVSMVLW
jgi:6-phosphofructokinase